MMYLIGGPPKCGKTTLAKLLMKEACIPWISTDALENVVYPYINKKYHIQAFPHSYLKGDTNDETYGSYGANEIMQGYINQSPIVYDAVTAFCKSEMTDGNSFSIEGYHVTPSLIAKLSRAFPGNISGIILYKTNAEGMIKDFQKSTTPNDWILRKTHQQETFGKIASMISLYGEWFEQEAQKFNIASIRTDSDFDAQLKHAKDALFNVAT